MYHNLEKYHADKDFGILLIRLALAAVFLNHGWQKFQTLDATVGFFGMLGLPAFFAYLVAMVELLGGLAMLLGVFTAYAGLLLAVVMMMAIYLVKFPIGFLGGYELDLTLLLTSIGIVMTGPGQYTFKRLMRKSE